MSLQEPRIIKPFFRIIPKSFPNKMCAFTSYVRTHQVWSKRRRIGRHFPHRPLQQRDYYLACIHLCHLPSWLSCLFFIGSRQGPEQLKGERREGKGNVVFNFSGSSRALFEEWGVADLFSTSKPFKNRGLLNRFSELCQILFLILCSYQA